MAGCLKLMWLRGVSTDLYKRLLVQVSEHLSAERNYNWIVKYEISIWKDWIYLCSCLKWNVIKLGYFVKMLNDIKNGFKSFTLGTPG